MKKMKKILVMALATFLMTTSTTFAAQIFPPQRPEVGVMMVEKPALFPGDMVVGLRTDGTINIKGNKLPVAPEHFTDVVDVTIVGRYLVALKSNGTITIADLVGYQYHLCNDAAIPEAATWTDIVDIDGAREHLVGLKSDGTVVAVGDNTKNQCSVAGWTNISQIFAFYNATLAVTKDGRVRATGEISQTDVDFYSAKNVKYLFPVSKGTSGTFTFYPMYEDGTTPYTIKKTLPDTVSENYQSLTLNIGSPIALHDYLKAVGITEEIVKIHTFEDFSSDVIFVLDKNGTFYEIRFSGNKLMEVKTLPVKITYFMVDELEDEYHAVAENGRIYCNTSRYDSADWVLTTNIDIDGYTIPSDVAPYIKDGRTLAPVRAILEALGMNVNWDTATRTVTATKDGTSIQVIIDNHIAYINGEAKELDVAPEITRDRTFVPVRFFAEALGLTVEWDAYTKTVVITSH